MIEKKNLLEETLIKVVFLLKIIFYFEYDFSGNKNIYF